MNQQHKDTLQGVVERITFADEENHFIIAKVREDRSGELVSVLGTMPGLSAGETLKAEGRWERNPRFGRQFRATSLEVIAPRSAYGIEKYLGSGLVKGIGPEFAARIVGHFGEETLEVIDRHPERLRQVPGIGPKRMKMILDSWVKHKALRDVMVFLRGHGLGHGQAMRIYKSYRNRTIEFIQQNPYRLAEEVWGIGFLTADRLAESLGVEPDSETRAAAGLLYILRRLAEDGHSCAPESMLLEEAARFLEVDEAILLAALEGQIQKGVLVRDGVGGRGGRDGGEPLIYVRPLFEAEDRLAGGLRMLRGGRRATGGPQRAGGARRAGGPQPPLGLRQAKIPWQAGGPEGPVRPRQAEIPRQSGGPMDIEGAVRRAEMVMGLDLAGEQVEAVRKAFTERLLVITGGPGVGKTTVIRGVVELFEPMGRRVLLAAPTGRAAKRLSEATGREAKTIHRLLRWSPGICRFEHNERKPLDAEGVIVDEASMIDLELMASLVGALRPGTSLILVGDMDQLPSVGPGNVLRDIIESRAVSVVRLREIFRQARESRIVINAHRILKGLMPDLQNPDFTELGDFYFVEQAEPDRVLGIIKALVADRIPRRFGMDPMADIQVVSPMHRGTVGAKNLNLELQKLLNPAREPLSRFGSLMAEGDKVMQIRNNYDKDVFNGDIGRIVRIDRDEERTTVDFDGSHVVYEYSELDEITLAYAISVHKSQGSEYPAVVMPILTQHYVMLQRNLLYTAVTRGKRLVVLVGTKKALAIAVGNDKVAHRYSLLAERLRGAFG
jgi:exodeoxyribonuclease V alpha subunit